MVDCIDSVLSSFKDTGLTRSDLKPTYEALTDATKRADYAKAASKIRKRKIEEVEAILREKAQTILVKQDLDRFVKSNELKGNDNIRAKVSGVSKSVTGGNTSYEATRNSIKGELYSLMHQGLNDLIPQIRGGDLDINTASAIINLNKGESISGFSETVQQFATIVKKTNDRILTILRESGLDIKERLDYITRQTHDGEKISGVSKDTWVGDIKKFLSSETFDDIGEGVEADKFLGDIYDEIVDGGTKNTIGFSVKGKRTFAFKDGASWAEYNKIYGKATLLDTVVQSVEAASKASAASHIFGPNSKQTFEWLEKRVAETITDKKALAKYNSMSFFHQGNQRLAWKKEMFGHVYDPTGERYAKSVRVLTGIQAISKLHAAVFSTASDTSFSTANFKAATGTKGVKILEGIGKFLSVFKGKERDKIASRLDMYFGDLQAEVYDRMGISTDGIMRKGSSAYSRMRDSFMSATLLEWQSSRAKTANAKWFAGYIHDVKDKLWSELDPSLKKGMERFDISEADWDIIRKGGESLDGTNFMVTSAKMRELGLDPKVVRKYSNYVGDMARVGSPEATIIERAKINQGLSSTDPLGAGARILFQFKSFPLALPRVFNRIGETAAATGGRKGYLTTTAGLAASAYMFHLAGQVAKDAVRGRKTKFDEAFFEDGFVGSVLPLSAQYTLDMIRGEYGKHGRNIFKSMAGPTFGQASDIVDLLAGNSKRTRKSVDDLLIGNIEMNSKTGMKAWRILQKNIPGYNMPIAGQVINYTFLNSIYEMLEPGYGNKQRKRDLKNGNEYYYDRSARFGE